MAQLLPLPPPAHSAGLLLQSVPLEVPLAVPLEVPLAVPLEVPCGR